MIISINIWIFLSREVKTDDRLGGAESLLSARREAHDAADALTHYSLFLQYLFNLTDFLLDFACEFFILAFGRQIGVVGDLAHLLFDRALKFMQISADFILNALCVIRFLLYSLSTLCKFQQETLWEIRPAEVKRRDSLTSFRFESKPGNDKKLVRSSLQAGIPLEK